MAGRSRVRWHHRPWARAGLARLAAGYISLIDRTGRWQVVCPEATADLVRAGRPFIGAFWHGRLLLIQPGWRHLLRQLGVAHPPDTYVISSAHGDGQLIQAAVNRFGLKTLWGSSRRGGAKVLREAQRALQNGDIVVMTPDGPRGPRMRVQRGIAYLAESTALPVVPLTFAARPQRRFESWDRFILVPPFAHGTLAFGEPILLPEGGEPEANRRLIEERLNALSIAIDEGLGLEPVLPADP
jgi:lysophospholipid acyltransferase (LPLAT)-like uncharacterized protein